MCTFVNDVLESSLHSPSFPPYITEQADYRHKIRKRVEILIFSIQYITSIPEYSNQQLSGE